MIKGSSLRIGGLNSGLDTEAIVNAMTASTKLRITTNQRKVLRLESQQEAYRSIIDKFNSFKDKYFDILNANTNLRSRATFSRHTAKMINSQTGAEMTPPGVRVSAGASAIPGTYTVSVSQKATQASLVSQKTDADSSVFKMTDKNNNESFIVASGTPKSFVMNVTVGGESKLIKFDGVVSTGVLADDRRAVQANINEAMANAFGRRTANADGTPGAGLVSLDYISSEGVFRFNSAERKAISYNIATELNNSVNLSGILANPTGNNSLTFVIEGQTISVNFNTLNEKHFEDMLKAAAVNDKGVLELKFNPLQAPGANATAQERAAHAEELQRRADLNAALVIFKDMMNDKYINVRNDAFDNWINEQEAARPYHNANFKAVSLSSLDRADILAVHLGNSSSHRHDLLSVTQKANALIELTKDFTTAQGGKFTVTTNRATIAQDFNRNDYASDAAYQSAIDTAFHAAVQNEINTYIAGIPAADSAAFGERLGEAYDALITSTFINSVMNTHLAKFPTANNERREESEKIDALMNDEIHKRILANMTDEQKALFTHELNRRNTELILNEWQKTLLNSAYAEFDKWQREIFPFGMNIEHPDWIANHKDPEWVKNNVQWKENPYFYANLPESDTNKRFIENENFVPRFISNPDYITFEAWRDEIMRMPKCLGDVVDKADFTDTDGVFNQKAYNDALTAEWTRLTTTAFATLSSDTDGFVNRIEALMIKRANGEIRNPGYDPNDPESLEFLPAVNASIGAWYGDGDRAALIASANTMLFADDDREKDRSIQALLTKAMDFSPWEEQTFLRGSYNERSAFEHYFSAGMVDGGVTREAFEADFLSTWLNTGGDGIATNLAENLSRDLAMYFNKNTLEQRIGNIVFNDGTRLEVREVTGSPGNYEVVAYKLSSEITPIQRAEKLEELTAGFAGADRFELNVNHADFFELNQTAFDKFIADNKLNRSQFYNGNEFNTAEFHRVLQDDFDFADIDAIRGQFYTHNTARYNAAINKAVSDHIATLSTAQRKEINEELRNIDRTNNIQVGAFINANSVNDIPGLGKDDASITKIQTSTRIQDIEGLEKNESGMYSFEINGVKFNFNGNETITQMMSVINANAAANVTISYSSFNNQFSITSRTFGTASKVELGEDESGLLKALGFALDETTGTLAAAPGENLKLRINNEEIETSSNSYTFNGITITIDPNATIPTDANGDPLPFDIVVQRDTSALADMIKDFVKDYNEMIDFVFGFVNEKPDRDYYFLTDTDREELNLTELQEKRWEDRAKKGLLYNCRALTGIMSKMRTAMFTGVARAGEGGAMFGLFSMGISTSNNWRQNGKLVIDETKLMDAITNDIDMVTEFFTNAQNGLMPKLDDIIKSAVNPIGARHEKGILVQRAGQTNSSSATDNAIHDQIKRINDMISRLEIRYSRQQDRYWKIFSGLEQQMGTLQSQGDYITNMMGGFFQQQR